MIYDFQITIQSLDPWFSLDSFGSMKRSNLKMGMIGIHHECYAMKQESEFPHNYHKIKYMETNFLIFSNGNVQYKSNLGQSLLLAYSHSCNRLRSKYFGVGVEGCRVGVIVPPGFNWHQYCFLLIPLIAWTVHIIPLEWLQHQLGLDEVIQNQCWPQRL